ncbi:MAG TPA: DUF4126 domain-containing protein [Longimicrobiales bacterium]
MEPIATLGAVLGLGFVSGIRLYSTILAVGLGIRFGLLDVPDALSHLDVLASTPVLAVAATVYTVEFVADKIPLVDSMWDAVHTFIRPVGAALVGGTAIGPVDPGVKLAVALLCGFVALSGHGAKATTRVAVNHSPEPFTNAGISLAEDGLVIGGVWLALEHPLITLGVVAILVVLSVWLIWFFFSMVRRFVRTLFHPEAPPTPS